MTIPKNFDRLNAAIALGVCAVTLVVYWITKAPTLSFWDCGEFIASCHILGIPHPPGTPLYILLGRIFAMVPFQEDIATRINALSSLSNAVTALFGYLIGVRLLRILFGNDSSVYSRLLLYAGSVSGTFFLAFGLTQWNNSVEAEVYGLSMLLFMAILWLSLIYLEDRGTATSDRIMLLMIYLAVLGIGVHMTTFMALPACGMLFLMKKDTPARVWYILGAFVLFELYLIFALSSRIDEIQFYIPVAIVLTLYLFYILSFEQIDRAAAVIGGGLLLSVVPLFGVISPAALKPLMIVGVISFAATNLWAVLVLLRSFSKTNGKTFDHIKVLPSYFVFAADIMILLVKIDFIRGYESFLWLSAAAALAVASFIWGHIRPGILIALGGVSLVVIGMESFAYGLAASLVVILVVGAVWKLPHWKSAMLIPVVAAIGFSVHAYIPIRSEQQPVINENNPSQSIAATIAYIERKQYGSMSMIERMFKRRAEWKNQFGDYRRMGFWRFFSEQYGSTGPKFFVLFIFGVFGIWEIVRRKPSVGVVFAVLLLLASVGLILYMNFADGTRQHPVSGADYIEVRNRDYFFTPAFVLFGLTIGIGISAVIQYLRELTVRLIPATRRAILLTAPMLFLLPAWTMAENYYQSDRSRNYIPYDYAFNLLSSADSNAVLFTSGDNDTFPLWCLQEVYGIRKDVINVNLSLANTHWYIKQLRDTHGLILSWSDKRIDQLIPYRVPDGRTFRVQDQVIDEIITYNAADRPINFSITTPSSARKIKGVQIDSLLELSALKFRLRKSGKSLTINIDETAAYFEDSSRFRASGLNDPSIYKSEATRRVAGNIANSFLVMADTLRLAGEYGRAEELVRKSLVHYPFVAASLYLLAEILAQQGKVEEINTIRDTVNVRDQFRGRLDMRRLGVSLARGYRRLENHDRAADVLKHLLIQNTSYRPALDELLRIYVQAQDVDKIREILRWWVTQNPADRQMLQMLRQAEGSASRI